MREMFLGRNACPFCNGNAIQLVCKGKSGGDREIWLECTECGGRSGSVKVPTSVFTNCTFCKHICDDAKQVVLSACSKWDKRGGNL